MKAKILVMMVVSILGMPAVGKATLTDSNSIVKNHIEYYMQTDKAIYNLGGNVQMLYRVTNLSDQDVSFEFTSTGQYHFEVTNNGNLIWFEPKADEPMLTGFVLEPNGYKEYTETWNMVNENGTPWQKDDDFPANPGTYDVTGSLNPWTLRAGYEDKYVPVSVPIEIIPEPSSLLLMGTGLAGLLAYNRKKKK